MEANQLILSGRVIEVQGLRYTPAGVPHFRFVMEHRSRQLEAGLAREVNCRIQVEARGDEADLCKELAVGDSIKVVGFLARTSYKESKATQLVLHVRQVEFVN